MISRELMEILIGVLATVILGAFVKPLLDHFLSKPERPEEMTEQTWDALTHHYHAGGRFIGFLERLLTFGSFWIKRPELIVAWLGFKVAAKWETWKNIVQTPKRIDNIPQTTLFKARRLLGSWLLSRFLAGTLMNILIGAIGAYFGRRLCEIVALFSFLCTPR